jgi:hypothetical protein
VTDRVWRPSIIEIRTISPRYGVSHTVPIWETSAERTLNPPGRSIRRTRSGGSELPGTSSPISSRVPTGNGRGSDRDFRPSESTAGTSIEAAGTVWKSWVHRHTRHRATPLRTPFVPPPTRGSRRRIRCSVSRPQFSHSRRAKWTPAAGEGGGGAGSLIAIPSRRPSIKKSLPAAEAYDLGGPGSRPPLRPRDARLGKSPICKYRVP